MKKILGILMLGAMAVSCKPTEKNYQTAYDLAVQKREEALTSVSGGMLDAIDGAHKQAVDGDTIYVVSGTFKPYETISDSASLSGKIGVAVAKYGMDTNARHHAADLRMIYPGAFVATDGKKHYYVVVDRRNNFQEALPAIRAFEKKNPDFHYIALPAPCAILLVE